MYALIRYWEPGPPLHSQASYQCPEHTLGRPGLLLKVRALAQRTDTFSFDSLLLPSPCLGRPVPSAHDLSLPAISPSRPRQGFGKSIQRTWAPNEPGIAGRLSLRPLRVMKPPATRDTRPRGLQEESLSKMHLNCPSSHPQSAYHLSTSAPLL